MLQHNRIAYGVKSLLRRRNDSLNPVLCCPLRVGAAVGNLQVNSGQSSSVFTSRRLRQFAISDNVVSVKRIYVIYAVEKAFACTGKLETRIGRLFHTATEFVEVGRAIRFSTLKSKIGRGFHTAMGLIAAGKAGGSSKFLAIDR